MKTQYRLFIILCLSILLTGCWDLIEINQYFFISAIGIDMYKKEENPIEEDEKEEINKIAQEDRFIITYSTPDLRAVGKNATSDEPRIIMSSISSNFYETTKELATRTNRNFTFTHTKVVIIGEEVAKNQNYMKEIFDNMGRHEQLSRKTSVLIAKGEAKEVMKIEDPFEPVTGYLVNQITEKKQGGARYSDMVLEEILTELYFNGDVLMPRIVPGKGEIKVAGTGIIKDFRLIGWLGEIETIAAMFLLDRVNTALINIKYLDTILPYIITNTKTKTHLAVEEGKIKYIANIDTEGYMQQYILDAEDKLTDQRSITAIEKQVKDTLEKQIKATFNKLQKEFKVDALGLGRHIRKFKPDLWDEVEDNWDDIFENIEFEVNVDARLRRIGMTK
ncbi:MAG: Ger(x)C family spore germination protein [Tissierellales bacterium]